MFNRKDVQENERMKSYNCVISNDWMSVSVPEYRAQSL